MRHIDRRKSVVTARGKGGRGRWNWAMGTQREFAWGDGSTMQCADDAYWVYYLKPVWFCKPVSAQYFQ